MKEIMRFVVSVQAMQDFHKSAIMRNPVKLDSVYVLEEMETGECINMWTSGKHSRYYWSIAAGRIACF